MPKKKGSMDQVMDSELMYNTNDCAHTMSEDPKKYNLTKRRQEVEDRGAIKEGSQSSEKAVRRERGKGREDVRQRRRVMSPLSASQ